MKINDLVMLNPEFIRNLRYYSAGKIIDFDQEWVIVKWFENDLEIPYLLNEIIPQTKLNRILYGISNK